MSDAQKDLMDLIKATYPSGGRPAAIRRYIGAIARAALDQLESGSNCPDGWTECSDGSCVPDPLMCGGEPVA